MNNICIVLGCEKKSVCLCGKCQEHHDEEVGEERWE